ncbi:MAG TPA: hypothetical protein VM324_00845 [Egibacteraceae bacterium]|nr:hypothetical protein [Egibacteraceae bacterium]
MSTDGPPHRTLGEYVGELVRRLGDADAAALARLRAVVGSRQARITLDDETVDVAFTAAGLVAAPAAAGAQPDGHGATDRATVLHLLDGYLEVTEAVLTGRLRVQASDEAAVRMLQAIEILLDASARSPALQDLARDFRSDPGRAGRPTAPAPRPPTRYPGGRAEAEDRLLERLDLLPDGDDPPRP